ncbi:MAG: tyrosine--tRNA ligase [Candidatus Paceibacterota bacterium]
MNITTGKERIDEVLTRGVAELLPSREKVEERLSSGERLRIYLGIDATGAELHLGHTKNILLLERLRRLGHVIILLFGDFTAMIGDPTDKGAARQRLTKEEVEENIASWKEQITPILSLDDPENPAQIRQNSEWLSKLGFNDVVDIASNFTVQHMLERDMFEKRMNEGKPVYVHEFMYPLMQGYDSVAMDVDGEVGGTDQTFNMLAGRSLQQTYNTKEKFIITMSLIADPVTGKKIMSKSEGDYVSLTATSEDMYGGVMALPDGVIVQMFEGCTFVPMKEVDEVRAQLEGGEVNPRDLKMKLAQEITKMYHGEEAAEKAGLQFTQAFSERSVPSEINEVSVVSGALLVDVLVEHGVVESKSAFRRLVEAGAVRDMESEEKISDQNTAIERPLTLRVGKKQFIKITPQE